MKMKSIFKKAVSVLCAAAVVATCFSSSMFVFAEDTNVLKDNGTLYWDEAKRETKFTADLTANTLTDGIIDGTGSNVWQPPKGQDKDISVYIKLDDSVDLEKIVVYGEATDYAFEIRYTTETVTATNFADMAAIKYDVLCDNTNVTGTAVTAKVTEYVLEGFTKVEGVTALELYTTHGSNNWLKYIEVEGYGAVATTPDPDEPEQPTGPVNIALSKNGGTAFALSQQGTNVIANLNDGSVARWQPTNNGANDTEAAANPVTTYAGVYWNEAKSFKDVTLYWREEPHSPVIEDYVIKVSNDTTNGKDGTWTKVELASKTRSAQGNFSSIAKHLTGTDTTNKSVKDTIVFKEVQTAKAIKIEITQRKRQAQFAELEVYSFVDTSFAKTEQYSSAAKSGDETLSDRLIVTNIDKNAVAGGKTIKATFTITRDGESETDTIELDTAWKSISLTINENATTVDAKALGGTEDQYVTGFILRDLLATDTVTVEFSVE